MLNFSNVAGILPTLLNDATTTTEGFAEVTLGEGGTVVDTMVNGFTGMTTGFLDAIKTGFDKLALNSTGTGLSMLAIWGITFAGVAMAPRAIKWVMNMFQTYKANHAGKQ